GVGCRRVRDRLREQPVREPRVSWQQRSVQIRADGTAQPAAFVAAPAVVAETGDDAPQWLGVGVELRPPGVVLEAGERPARPGAIQQDIADHAAFAGNRLQREQTKTGQLRSTAITIETP